MLKANDQQSKDRRRQHILESAERVLKQKGLSGLSISSVAKEANLAQGTLYLYFKKKEEIIGQLTVRSRERLLELFHEAISSTNHPMEQLSNIMYANLTFFQEDRLYYDLASFYELSAEEKEPEELYRASQNITALVVSVVDRAKSQGYVRNDLDATAFTYLAWGMSSGMVQLVDIQRQAIASNLHKNPEEMYAHYVDFVLSAVRVA